ALSIKKFNPAKYDNIIRSYRCKKNYEKSSGTMKSAAILIMFKRSVPKYGVYYTKYVGDGDSKTFSVRSKIVPYPVHNILRLQMTLAFTIRKSKHDLDLLFNGSWGIFWHKCSTNDDPHHDYCSIDWCGYLKFVRDKTPYDHTLHALSRPVLDAIKPVFKNLCSRKSLARVVDASTQNPNEDFHSDRYHQIPDQ
ncbi:unnamed protein product, partial [Rotaria sp. Silwood2]